MSIVTAEFNDYTYYCDTETLECSARVTEAKRTQTTFNGLFDEVIVGGRKYTLTSLNYDDYGCFEDCTSLEYPPRIPSTVKNMAYCFANCPNLKFPPLIPSSVINMYYCFSSCTNLWKDYNIGYQFCYAIPDSVKNMECCFLSCEYMLAAPRMPRNREGITIKNCFSRCSRLQYAGGFPPALSAYASQFAFNNCPALIYGPEIIDVNGVNCNSAAYTGTTLTSGNLLRPQFSTTTGKLNIKTLLTKLMGRGLYGNILTPNIRGWSSDIGLFGNTITHLSDYRKISALPYVKYVKDISGWGMAAYCANPTNKITFTDSFTISRANAWQSSLGLTTQAGIEGDFGLWGCLGNMTRSNSSYATGPCYLTGSLNTSLMLKGMAYYFRAATTDTTPDTTYTWYGLGWFGGKSIDDRAVRWDYTYEQL